MTPSAWRYRFGDVWLYEDNAEDVATLRRAGIEVTALFDDQQLALSWERGARRMKAKCVQIAEKFASKPIKCKTQSQADRTTAIATTGKRIAADIRIASAPRTVTDDHE